MSYVHDMSIVSLSGVSRGSVIVLEEYLCAFSLSFNFNKFTRKIGLIQSRYLEHTLYSITLLYMTNLGMERVASITSSYYKYSEAAILVFALDNPDTFHILSQHLLDIVTYAENAKIFL